MLRATQREGKNYLQVLSRNQLHCGTVIRVLLIAATTQTPSLSRTSKDSHFKKVSGYPPTDLPCQNVFAHASRSKRAVRACLIHSWFC
jgi:hypothetical protein